MIHCILMFIFLPLLSYLICKERETNLNDISRMGSPLPNEGYANP